MPGGKIKYKKYVCVIKINLFCQSFSLPLMNCLSMIFINQWIHFMKFGKIFNITISSASLSF